MINNIKDKIIIPTENIPTLNQHDEANRTSKYSGASMKKSATGICSLYIRKAMNEGFRLKQAKPMFHLTWYAKDRRTDKDNISFADKYIYDGMVNTGLLENDGFNNLGDFFINEFRIDKDNPRVEIVEIKVYRVNDQELKIEKAKEND